MLLYDILIDPGSRKKLKIDPDRKQISNIDLTRFNAGFEDNIPVILPRDISDELKQSEFHQNTRSVFNYLDHYKKDAECFDYFAETGTRLDKDERNRLHQKILSRIPGNAGIVLDIGCGNGWLSKQVVNQTVKVISMDISTINVKRTLKNFPHVNHYGLVADVFNLPIADESVDCIVASEIMEHITNPKLFVETLMKPLKQGGKLIITTPYNEKIVYHLCVHCNRPTPANAHINSFNEYKIQGLIPDNVAGWNFGILINKYLLKLRIYLVLKYLPFKIWQLIDNLANVIIKNPTRLLIEIKK